jgi:hypothetical protein
MKRIVLLACLAAVQVFGQTVTSITVSDISHSDALIHFNTSASWNYVRTRWGTTACTGGTGGTVQPSLYPNGAGSSTRLTTNHRLILGGLPAATLIHVCPEVSTDGVTYSSGIEQTFTTLALPATHPALPTAPTTYQPSYPDTTGYLSVNITIGGGGDCTQLQTEYDAAITRQATQGTIINIPAQSGGSSCLTSTAGGGIFWANNRAADVHTFAASAVTQGTSTINLPSHGLSEGQGLIFGSQYSDLPGSNGKVPINDPATCTGIIPGTVYYAHLYPSDPTNTIQLSCQKPYASGGPLMAFASAGSGTTLMWVTTPRTGLKWIIIRTATPDSQFVPQGTRVSPSWAPKMAKLVNPYLGNGGGIITTPSRGAPNTLFTIDNSDGNEPKMVGRVWITGLEMTVLHATDWDTSTDPISGGGIFGSSLVNSEIVLDRNYIHGEDAPGRMYTALNLDGHNVYMQGNYLEKMDIFQPAYDGLALTRVDNTHFTIASGTNFLNGSHSYVQAGTATVTLSGTNGGGYGKVYASLATPSVLTVQVPPGMNASCTGATCAVVVASSAMGAGGCNRDDSGWPFNSEGRVGVGMIGCLNFTGNNLSSVSNANTFASTNLGTDGCQCIQSGHGPGPLTVENNFISATGNVWHVYDNDNSGAGGRQVPYIDKNDFYFRRNTFDTPLSHLWNNQYGRFALSNGLEYRQRSHLEFKAGQRIKIDGNTFQGGYKSIASSDVAITSVCDEPITDVEMVNNTWKHTFGVAMFSSATEGGCVQNAPGNRMYFHNNLAFDVDGYKYWDTAGGFSAGAGWVIQSGYGEDNIIAHNTVVANTGAVPAFWWLADVNPEGSKITDNIFYITAGAGGGAAITDNRGLGADGGINPGGNLGKAFADARLPNNTISGNLFLGNTTQATISGWWPSGGYVPATPSDLTAVGWLRYAANADADLTGTITANHYRLKNASSYVSGGASKGSDGLDVGVNMTALDSAQGKVTLIGPTGITTTTAGITFVAPDAQACPVDYSATDPTLITSFSRATGTGATGPNTVSLTGLTTKTVYYYRVNCAVQQPTGQFRTK